MKYRYPQNRKITANISVELVSLVAWNQDCSGHRSRHLHSESDSLRGMLRMQGGRQLPVEDYRRPVGATGGHGGRMIGGAR